METEDNGAGGRRLLHGRLPVRADTADGPSCTCLSANVTRLQLTMHGEDYSPWPTPDLVSSANSLPTSILQS